MLKHQYQAEIKDSDVQALALPDAQISHWPAYLGQSTAYLLFEQLMQEIEWRQEKITLFGKTHKVPRLSCWMADVGLDYSYSNMTMRPVAWIDCVERLRDQLQCDTGHLFNSVLLNYYRDGRDSNGWHSDDEAELGSRPVIASLSLGAARDFQLRHRHHRKQRYSLSLANGSLLLMQGDTQRCWQHQLPKRARAEGRINLTFRKIVA